MPFEDTPGAVSGSGFDEIWSADAFHWIDPDLAYPTAARLLRSGGRIVLLWSFPFLADPDLQRSLNELYARVSPDLVRDPVTHLADLEPALIEGREQLAMAGGFEAPVHWMDHSTPTISPPEYVALQCSYGQVARLPGVDLAALRDGIVARLGRLEEVTLSWTRYVVSARFSGGGT